MSEKKQKWFSRENVIVALIGLISAVLVAAIEKLDSSESKPKPIPDEQENVDLSFVCSSSKTAEGLDIPTTVIRSASKDDVPMFYWKDTSFGPRFTPIERCQEVSRRLQIFYNENELEYYYYIIPGELNSYPVLCVSKEFEGRCNDDNLLITLKFGENASQVLQEIISFEESGGVAITRSDGSYIDVLEYWRTAPTTNSNSSP